MVDLQGHKAGSDVASLGAGWGWGGCSTLLVRTLDLSVTCSYKLKIGGSLRPRESAKPRLTDHWPGLMRLKPILACNQLELSSGQTQALQESK